MTFSCLRDGGVPVAAGRPGSSWRRVGPRLSSAALLGGFFDTDLRLSVRPARARRVRRHARRSATRRRDRRGVSFPLGRGGRGHAPTISARIERDAQGWSLLLATDRLAQSVHVLDDGFRPDDDWFHLAPGPEKRVRLRPRGAGQNPPEKQVPPAGKVLAVNASSAFSYRAS